MYMAQRITVLLMFVTFPKGLLRLCILLDFSKSNLRGNLSVVWLPVCASWFLLPQIPGAAH